MKTYTQTRDRSLSMVSSLQLSNMVRVPDPWVIDEKNKRERKKKEHDERLPAVIPISLPEYDHGDSENNNGHTKPESEPKSTVIIIDI